MLKSLQCLKAPSPALVLRREYNGLHATVDAKPVEGSMTEVVNTDFLPLELYPNLKKRYAKRVFKSQYVAPPRADSMSPEQDWPSVWPAPRTFHPATVPLAVRQGYPATNKPTPGKYGNLELMKIPNFLHLTPPAVERHCAAIKKYCTPFPKGVLYPSSITQHVAKPDPDAKHHTKLHIYNRKVSPREEMAVSDPSTEEKRHDYPGYFPVIETKHSYLYSSFSIRDARARCVQIKVDLADLQLSASARDKLLRLVKHRYDRDTNTLTLSADRCPLGAQNSDYLHYLLTVLLYEANKTEPWEHEITREDYGQFVYEGSEAQRTVQLIHRPCPEGGEKETISEEQEQRYSEAVATVLHNGETDANLFEYTKSVLDMYGIKDPVHEPQSDLNTPQEVEQLLEPDIRGLYSWRYQESKDIEWILSGWLKYRGPMKDKVSIGKL